VAYIDLKAAYGSVDRDTVWKTLQDGGTPSFILYRIRNLHTGTSAHVRIQHMLHLVHFGSR